MRQPTQDKCPVDDKKDQRNFHLLPRGNNNRKRNSQSINELVCLSFPEFSVCHERFPFDQTFRFGFQKIASREWNSTFWLAVFELENKPVPFTKFHPNQNNTNNLRRINWVCRGVEERNLISRGFSEIPERWDDIATCA